MPNTNNQFKTKAIISSIAEGTGKTSGKPYFALSGVYENGSRAFILLDDKQKQKFASLITEISKPDYKGDFLHTKELTFDVELDFKGNPRLHLVEVK